MKESKFNEEQIIAILREAERGKQTIAAVYRAHGVIERTFAWINCHRRLSKDY